MSQYIFLGKALVPSQEYDSCYPFVWCAWTFDFANWLGTFRFKLSMSFGIFVIILLVQV